MSSTVYYKFQWPQGPENVILTGDFDNWQGSLPLVKQPDGGFEISIPMDIKELEEKRFYFKFIVDGDWTINDSYKKESDGHGFDNNYVDHEDLVAIKSKQANQTRIPEAGGMPMPITNNSNNNNDGTFHILPIVNPPNLPNPGGNAFQTPGPVIVSNADDIQEFHEVRDVDADELNAKMNAKIEAKKLRDEEQKKVSRDAIDPKPSNKQGNITKETPHRQHSVKEHDTTQKPVATPKVATSKATPQTKDKTTEKPANKTTPSTVKRVEEKLEPTKQPPKKTATDAKNIESNKNAEKPKPKKTIMGRLKKMFT